MAITDSQKVDLLWKKVGFGKAKTDTNANKKAPNEGTNSDFIIKVDQIWAQSASIPGVIPTSNSSIVTCLLYTSPSPRDRTRSRMPSSA